MSKTTTYVIDDCVMAHMQRCNIPGLSLAIVQDGQIVQARGYGQAGKDHDRPVTSSTLFQAASISKPVTALAVLRLAGESRLSLDEDVNNRLRTWTVPENAFTQDRRVTLRSILSHSAGLTVHGFPGYAAEGPFPTLVQVLDGVPPANTHAVRVDLVPGSQQRYSGGGFTVAQQLLLDIAEKPFPEFMHETVLLPFGMESSTYEQPLPTHMAGTAATGHYQDGKVVKGRWHVYPEMAAAGLWTTPSDLARFAIGVQRAVAGASHSILSKRAAKEMLTGQNTGVGLGVALDGTGATRRFQHGGRNEGFDAMLMAYVETGQGAAIMINTNDNSGAMLAILQVIGKEYKWADFPEPQPAASADALPRSAER